MSCTGRMVGPSCQSAAIVVRQMQAMISRRSTQHSIFFDEVRNGLSLPPSQPAKEHAQHYLPRGGVDHEAELISRRPQRRRPSAGFDGDEPNGNWREIPRHLGIDSLGTGQISRQRAPRRDRRAAVKRRPDREAAHRRPSLFKGSHFCERNHRTATLCCSFAKHCVRRNLSKLKRR